MTDLAALRDHVARQVAEIERLCDRKKIYARPCGPCPSMKGSDPESRDIREAVERGDLRGRDWVFPCAWRRRKICHGIAKSLNVKEADL